MRPLLGSLLLLCLVSAVPLACGAGEAFAGQSNAFTVSDLPQHVCARRAARTITNNGYRVTSGDDSTVFYESGPYSCCVRCMTDHGIIFFYCVGPNGDQAERIVDSVRNNTRWERREW